LISTVTDAVLETVGEWQDRLRNKAVYIALGVQADGTKDILVFGSRTAKGPSSGCAS
jgi:putative transposase